MLFFKFIKVDTLIFSMLLLTLINPVACGDSMDDLQLTLKEARKNLQISQATEEKVASELEELKKSGKATPEILKDYETYLARLQEIVAENRKIVEEMEKVYARLLRKGVIGPAAVKSQPEKAGDTEIPEEEERDTLVVLDSQLDDSLADFDEMLLKEMDAIQAKSAKRMKELSEEASEAAERLREKGMDVGSSSEAGSDKGDKDLPSGKEGEDQRKGEQGESDSKVAGGSKRDARDLPAGGTYGKEAEPERDSDQDDIVARQLREAAEKETDPELKAKLWKEYEDYKKSSR